MLDQPYASVPYRQATPTQQEQARRLIRQRFQTSYPTLTPTQWEEAILSCYPVLEADERRVELREDDLTRLATYLGIRFRYADTTSPERLAYCGASRHVAQKLQGFSRRAVLALAQAAALPPQEQHEAADLYRWALEAMTGGDAVANAITNAFAFRSTQPSRIRYVYPRPDSSVSPPATAPPPAAPAKRPSKELPDQWDHLQQWFARTNDPARPWNVSAIARQLQLGQPVVRALLMAPKGTPGVSRVAFSRARLRRLQQYFLPYGYQVPS